VREWRALQKEFDERDSEDIDRQCWNQGHAAIRRLQASIAFLAKFKFTFRSPAPSPGPVAQAGTRTPADTITILFLGANPSNATRLSLSREIQEIDDRLRMTEFRDCFRLEQQWELRADEVPRKIMRFKPQIVHFSGHGNESGQLIFQNTRGRSSAANRAALGRIFGAIGGGVRCVVLNACFSKRQAEIIAEHIDVVIGMSQAIWDTSAVAFAGGFYEALGYGKSLATAFALARDGIALSGHSGIMVPQLVVRSGVNPHDIYLVGSSR
jgi:hypothetical protein